MKKVLSLMMMAMLAIGAWAGEGVYKTLTFSAETNSESIGSYTASWSATIDGFTWNLQNFNNNNNSWNYVKCGRKNYASIGTISTASAIDKAVTKVVVTVDALTASKINSTTLTVASDADFTTDVQTVEVAAAQGEMTYVIETPSTDCYYKLTYDCAAGSSNGLITISKVEYFTNDGGTTPSVATPVITGETPFTESTEVSITCATEGASIYYTLDGATPTNASTEYSGAFELTETTTVKAIAYDANNNASSVATKEFVKEEPVVLTNVATVAEFNALADGTDFIFTGNLVATGQTGKYLYAQDSDNGILIYGTIDQTYSDLAEIPGGWTGKKTTFNGAPEAAEPAGLAAATEHVDLAPDEMTPAQVTLENAFKYVVIRGATVTMTNNNNGTITVGDETVALYKRFNVTIPTDDGVYDIIGITGYYNAPQFMPLEFVPQGVEVATPVIEGETPFVGSTTVTITCATEGASIYYTTDGTEPTNQSTAYTAPFELTESATVKAIAYDANNNASVVASKEFVKTPSISTAAEYNALPENTTFVFNGNLVVSGQKNKYLYAQDATGGVLIYGTAPTYSKGDVIPAGFTAKKINYNGTIEMSEMTGMQAATETAELVAQELAINQFADNQNIYAVVKGATVEGNTLTIGEETLAIYNRFGITFPTDDKTYDVYGVATIYNNAPQLLPIEFVEVVEKTASPVITVEEGDEYYVVTAIGDGEVKLYIDEMEVENPYVVVRTSEEQVFTFVATAQEEGKEVSDPTMLTIIVPKLEVIENTITFEAEQEGGTIAVALADGTPVESGVTKVAAGEKVTITATPTEGYKLSELVVKCGDEVVEFDTEIPGRAAETRTFTMPEGEVSIEATFEKETPTGIESLSMENVKSVRFYNAAGVESATPFHGVNIVVRVMTDGSKSVTKVVK
jgi:hypothetical protein